MTGRGQIRLVAVRELRERSRSRAFRASLIGMLLFVAGVITVPALVGGDEGGAKDVGLTGAVPAELPAAVQAQSDAVGSQVRVHRYDDVAAGQKAVRSGDVDVLVVDGRRLEWRDEVDEQLRAGVAGAIQLVAVRERAAAAGITVSVRSAPGAGTQVTIDAAVPAHGPQPAGAAATADGRDR